MAALVDLFRPELGAIVQPLAGEWAIRRNVFEQLHVPIGYGVEFSTLLDVYDEWGIDSIAQVDLGRRAHRHQNIHDLSVMAVEILATAERRRARTAGPTVTDAFSPDVQVARLSEHRQWSYRAVPVIERLPASTLIGPAD